MPLRRIVAPLPLSVQSHAAHPSLRHATRTDAAARRMASPRSGAATGGVVPSHGRLATLMTNTPGAVSLIVSCSVVTRVLPLFVNAGSSSRARSPGQARSRRIERPGTTCHNIGAGGGERGGRVNRLAVPRRPPAARSCPAPRSDTDATKSASSTRRGFGKHGCKPRMTKE